MLGTTLKDFEILSKLGEGAYSQVFRVKRISDNNVYALKKVKLQALSQKEKENALNEVRILASLNDPNIIGYKEAFLDESGNMNVVMEFAGGGDLYQKISNCKKKQTYIPEPYLWRYLIQLLQGLRKLHSMKIFHRDLKTANIFLTSDLKNVKLGDLNVSKVAKSNLAYTQTGTPYYASPEVWRDEPYDQKSDIWSLGCVIYEAASKNPPFRAETMEGLFRKVQKGIFERIPNHYSEELNSIIKLCLKLTAKTRPDAEELLNHPIILKKLSENDNFDLNFDSNTLHESLMGTIKVPRNINDLNKILPKPNYDSGRSPSKQEQRPQSSVIQENKNLKDHDDVLLGQQMNSRKSSSKLFNSGNNSNDSKQPIVPVKKEDSIDLLIKNHQDMIKESLVVQQNIRQPGESLPQLKNMKRGNSAPAERRPILITNQESPNKDYLQKHNNRLSKLIPKNENLDTLMRPSINQNNIDLIMNLKGIQERSSSQNQHRDLKSSIVKNNANSNLEEASGYHKLKNIKLSIKKYPPEMAVKDSAIEPKGKEPIISARPKGLGVNIRGKDDVLGNVSKLREVKSSCLKSKANVGIEEELCTLPKVREHNNIGINRGNANLLEQYNKKRNFSQNNQLREVKEYNALKNKEIESKIHSSLENIRAISANSRRILGNVQPLLINKNSQSKLMLQDLKKDKLLRGSHEKVMNELHQPQPYNFFDNQILHHKSSALKKKLPEIQPNKSFKLKLGINVNKRYESNGNSQESAEPNYHLYPNHNNGCNNEKFREAQFEINSVLGGRNRIYSANVQNNNGPLIQLNKKSLINQVKSPRYHNIIKDSTDFNVHSNNNKKGKIFQSRELLYNHQKLIAQTFSGLASLHLRVYMGEVKFQNVQINTNQLAHKKNRHILTYSNNSHNQITSIQNIYRQAHLRIRQSNKFNHFFLYCFYFTCNYFFKNQKQILLIFFWVITWH